MAAERLMPRKLRIRSVGLSSYATSSRDGSTRLDYDSSALQEPETTFSAGEQRISLPVVVEIPGIYCGVTDHIRSVVVRRRGECRSDWRSRSTDYPWAFAAFR